mgnify:CR=1 FL=1
MAMTSCLIAWTGCNDTLAARKSAQSRAQNAPPPAPNAPGPAASIPAKQTGTVAGTGGSPNRGISVLDDLRPEDFAIEKLVDEDEFHRMAEEVVATVGEKELRKKNVWEQFSVPPDTDTIPPFTPELLDKAIELELVYQEGLRRGIDKTDEFKTKLREEQIRKWKSGVPRLAGLMQEKELNLLSRTVPSSTPTAGQVDEIFAKCRASFPRERYSDEAVKSTIRALFERQGPYTAYQNWLADLFAHAQVSANGKPIPLGGVSQSLRSFSLSEGLRGVKAGEREAMLVYDILKNTLPGDTDVTTLDLEINGDAITLAEEQELQGILQKAREAHKEKLSAATADEAKDFTRKLFTVVKNYLLAQQAKKEGITLAGEGPLWETPPEKAIITSILIGTLVAEEPPVEPTREEIIAFYRTHPMYHGMEFETAKKRIYRRLSSELTRKAALDKLKARFPVRILAAF